MPQQPADASIHRLHEELLIKLKHDPRIFDFIEKSSLDGLWYWDLEHPEQEWMSESFWTMNNITRGTVTILTLQIA